MTVRTSTVVTDLMLLSIEDTHPTGHNASFPPNTRF
jgi:hypothetical protein